MNPIVLLSLFVAVVSANNYGGSDYEQGGHSRRVPHHRQRLHLVPAPAPEIQFVTLSQPETLVPVQEGPFRTTVFRTNAPAPVVEIQRPVAPVVEIQRPLGPVRTTVVNMEAPAPAPVAEVIMPLVPKEHHKITRFEQNIGTDTSNNVKFDTSNGIHTSDKTEILPGTPNPENPSELWNKIQKSGSYSYTSPEGIPISVTWTADGINGFRAVSSAIPTPVAPIV